MSQPLVIATRNRGKVEELRLLLADLDLRLFTPADLPDCPEVVEDGATFAENAIKKAVTLARHTGMIALADDSGLEVDALGGRPGVLSARFAGPGASDAANNRKLLDLLRDVPASERSARFRCAVAVAAPDGRVRTAEGTCEGLILNEARGNGGFGYDPLFFIPDRGKTMAELPESEKNLISHRGQAFRRARHALEDFLAELKTGQGG